jgi:hypothetical protein
MTFRAGRRWTALGFALALTEDVEAQTAGTKSHHTKHPKRSTVERATAPAEATPAEFKPTTRCQTSSPVSVSPALGRRCTPATRSSDDGRMT